MNMRRRTSESRQPTLAAFLLIACVCLLGACTPKVQHAEQPRPGNKYATGFQIDDTLGLTRVRVFAPWQPDSVMATYILVPSDSFNCQLSTFNFSQLSSLNFPLTGIAASSATHIGMIAELDQMDRLVGMCNPEVCYHELPATCRHIGDAMQPDAERILQSGAQAIMYSTYAPSDMSAQRLTDVGINVLYNNEWRESTPLARAEWIRFVAVFMGCLPKADSIFAEVDSAYNALAAQRSHSVSDLTSHSPKGGLTSHSPKGDLTSNSVSVLSGLDFRGTWYVPAGGTYMGALFRDAGAAYAFADDPRQSSIPLTFEQALVTFADADVWLGCNVPSREALLEQNSQYALFKAYQTGRLYNFRKRCLPSGANDFWESGVVHPERILHDIIATLNGDTAFYYINPVE